jgi:Leucine-rich repeat (LRR) protein
MKHFYILLTLTLLLSGTNAVAKNYNAHDLAKVKALLEQKATNSSRNIDILWGAGAPTTLSADGSNWVDGLNKFFTWNSEGRLTYVYILFGGHWVEESGVKVRIDNNYPRLGGGTLDLSGCTALKEVWARNNNFTSLNLSNCANLEQIWICLNQIKTINIEGSNKIARFHMSGNGFASLDISNRKELRTLYIPNNSLVSLNISGCQMLFGATYDAIMTYTTLVSLNVSNCNLDVLNLSENINLETLDCSGNNLHSLDISKNTKLKTLNAGDQTVIISDNGREVVLNNGETLTLPVLGLSGITVTPSGDGVVNGNNVIWRNVSTTGSYHYEFETSLPSRVTGTPLSGKATIGAVNKGNTIGEGGTPPSGGGCEPDSGSSTANEVVEVHTVYASNGQLYVQLSAPAVVRVHSIIGQVVAQTAKVTETTVALPKGIYFVSIGNSEAKKVVVR